MELGRLIEVNVRELWKHEQYDFSDWLGKKDNIELLNEVLGLTLVNINKEAYVGSYRCDIVAIDETSGIRVIVENQLDSSNHDHLGKIITYASGLNAKVVVWIVTAAREEHRSAIEWLNNNTNKEINFFLIELHAYRIGNSLPAPKFEIVEKPNDFIKSVKSANGNEDLSKSQSERLEFWSAFNDVILSRGKPFSIRKASTDHWYDVSIGTSKAHISITLVNKEGYVGVELTIHDEKGLFDNLFLNRESIEKEFGYSLEWQRLDTKKASRVILKINGLNFNDHTNYSSLMNDIIDKVISMRTTFQKYLK